jgi:hypothetical protein
MRTPELIPFGIVRKPAVERGIDGVRAHGSERERVAIMRRLLMTLAAAGVPGKLQVGLIRIVAPLLLCVAPARPASLG